MDGRILIVEDEQHIAELLSEVLRRERIGEPVVADCLRDARTAFGDVPVSLVILDVMLPDGSGFDLAAELRASSDVPILFLTARDTDTDKLAGFGVGADDYVTKPFNLMEVVARVRALLRRSGARSSEFTVRDFGRVVIEEESGRVIVDGTEVPMPAREFKLLCFLAASPGRIYSASQLYRQVWDEEPIGRADEKTVAVHVHRIRDRIERNPGEPALIVTVRGLGYKLVDPGGADG